jgi:hypothetical protein
MTSLVDRDRNVEDVTVVDLLREAAAASRRLDDDLPDWQEFKYQVRTFVEKPAREASRLLHDALGGPVRGKRVLHVWVLQDMIRRLRNGLPKNPREVTDWADAADAVAALYERLRAEGHI